MFRNLIHSFSISLVKNILAQLGELFIYLKFTRFHNYAKIIQLFFISLNR